MNAAVQDNTVQDGVIETNGGGKSPRPEETHGVKRYQLVLPIALYNRVLRAAEEQDVTVVQLLRAFVKIGLMVVEAQKQPGSALILRSNGTEKELVLV